ncbi:hypothetical protein [Thiobacillus thioparus]|uniref:hypothetical protein n=1 Tax=Thiobacillus thioparus TaxID=931 RepID=UPI0012FCD166|nr:hypothetical protein [Thiobacillus thioparus]
MGMKAPPNSKHTGEPKPHDLEIASGPMTEAGHIVVSKLDAAQRQLRVAIRMLFSEDDPVAVHTLVGAASLLFSDLVEINAPEQSWDKKAREATSLTRAEYFQVMRRHQNFFKHARDDHTAMLELNPEETESLAFWAVMNASELAPLSTESQVYQLWYIAARSPFTDPTKSPLREALQVFGDLRPLPRGERLKSGVRVLKAELSRVA